MMNKIDQRIDALNPGESIEISRTDAGWCMAERSGDGKTLRFVRHVGNTSTVFHTCAF